jgi:hypothetical protein
VVHAAGDELDFIKLEGSQGSSVTSEAADFFTGLEIPYASSAVVRTGDKDRKWQVR